MKWYQKEMLILKNRIVVGTIIVILIVLFTTLFSYLNTDFYVWEEISPITNPTLSIRTLSALCFLLPGNILYRLGFYKILYSPFKLIYKISFGLINLYPIYKKLKLEIWHGLIFIISFVIVPFIIETINKMVSFFYNIFMYLLFIYPMILISILIILIPISMVLLYRKYKN